MENHKPNFWISRSPDSYTIREDTEYITWHTGVFVMSGEYNTLSSSLTIGARAFAGELDYNRISGWYKLVVYAKKRKEWLFFGDASGSQYLFYDTDHHVFSDRLLHLRAMRGADAQPDLEAVSELFHMGRTFVGKTLVLGVKKTSPAHYYRLRNNQVEEFEKGLTNFSKMPSNVTLGDVVSPILQAIRNEKVCAVCTGGTDSRSVLAVLTHKGVKPGLVLTGHADNPDIPVAKQVAETLELPLTVLDPTEKEEGWMESAFVFLDGEYDVVLGYRHLQKARWAKESGYAYEFGGVGGEFYKNAFCHPYKWGLLKKRDEAYFMQNILKASTRVKPWYGEALKQAVANDIACLSSIVKEGVREGRSLEKCNRIGYALLGSASGAITNGYASVCCKIDPLMDRNLVAAASQERPVLHSMRIWQRRQIARYCPALSDITTDQGYTCSLKPAKLLREQAKKALFFISRAVARIRRKLGLRYKPKSAQYWNEDYIAARATEAWTDAVAYCKNAGIIKSDATDAEIPMDQTGFIILVGMMFGYGFEGIIARHTNLQ